VNYGVKQVLLCHAWEIESAGSERTGSSLTSVRSVADTLSTSASRRNLPSHQDMRPSSRREVLPHIGQHLTTHSMHSMCIFKRNAPCTETALRPALWQMFNAPIRS
jgi:hypothetical protein